ncbi:MAG: thioredoxin [Deltaproteobacteria bacterium]|nr:thioredoxin [Deltaproteobacteria bacterium]
MNSLVQDCSEADFTSVVVDGSAEQAILVDFWAPWCGPCKTLGPLLEKITADYAGAFSMVKINTDEAPALMAQFRFRSIPTVVLFKGGQPVDAFSGALPEPEVIAFLENNGLTPKVDEKMAKVERLMSDGQYDLALQKVVAMQKSDTDDVKLSLVHAQIALAQRDVTSVKNLLERLPKTDEANDVKAALEALLALDALAQTSDEQKARQELEQGDDVNAALCVAGWDVLASKTETAFASLLPYLFKNRPEVHPVLLQILSLCDDDKKRLLRRKLSMHLF